MYKVLIADDEAEIRDAIKFALRDENYQLLEAADGEFAWQTIRQELPDIIILDCMMPKLSGIEVLKKIRQDVRCQNCFVLLLTALASDVDIVTGFGAGADDYITKPFKLLNLSMKINALINRLKQNIRPASELQFYSLRVSLEKNEVTINGKPVKLTPKEIELLKLFLQNPNKTFSRDDLLTTVWKYDFANDSRTVDHHVCKLREKLAACPEFTTKLQAVRNRGYRLET